MQLPANVAPISKDHNTLNIITLENVVKQSEFFICSGDENLLLNGIGSYPLRFHLNRCWFIRPLFCKTKNFRGKRCRVQQGLTILFFRGHTHDAPHLRNKPHVQHTICFINHKNLNLVQVNIPIPGKINQTPRGCHQNIAERSLYFL